MRPFNMEDFKAGKKVVYRNGQVPEEIIYFTKQKDICVFSTIQGMISCHFSNGVKRELNFEAYDHGKRFDLMIEDEQFYAGIKSPRHGTANHFFISDSIEKLKDAGWTDSDIYKLVPTW